MNELIRNVLEWGHTRNLHNKDMRSQLVKLTEELGEIAAGVARQDHARIIDGVGDLLVVLINFGACFVEAAKEGQNPITDFEEAERLKDHFLESCLNHAWQVIKHRQGETRDGVFVKSEDI